MNYLGLTRLKAAPVRVGRPPFVTTVTCLLCGAALTVRAREVLAQFTIGNETIAIVCDECLDDESQAVITKYRAAAREKEKATR